MAGELQRFEFDGHNPVYAVTEQQARNVSGAGDAPLKGTGSASGGSINTVTPVGGASSKPVGTLNATINTPRAGTTVPAPVVVDSSMAEKDLAEKKAQADQMQQDTANHQTLINTPPPAPTAPGKGTPGSTPQKPVGLNDEINSLLGDWNTSQDTVDANANKQIAPLEAERQQMQQDFDQQAALSLKQLSGIASGVYPLSPAEQNLLSATQATFQSTIEAQQTANTAYTGQMTELMASLGISTSAPTQAIGMIHLAVTTGNQKVADLNAQMSKSLADLSLGFQKQDYELVSDAWTKQSKYLEDRITAISDMEKEVRDAAKQQKQDVKDYTTLALSTVMRSAEISETAKQHAIENAISQGRLSEEHRHNLATEGANGLGGGNFTSTQINTGAAAAGVPLETFKGYSADVKNLFINGDGKKTLQSIKDGLASGSVEDVTKAIKEMSLSPEQTAYLTDYAKAHDPGGNTAEKKKQTFIDTFTDLKGQEYDRNEAYSEVVDAWTDGGKTNLTKAEKKTIDDALGSVYGLRSFGIIPDTQYNDGSGDMYNLFNTK